MSISTTLSLAALFAFGLTNFFWKLATPSKPYQPSYLMIQGFTYITVMAIIHIIQTHPFTTSPKLVSLAVMGGICASMGSFATFLALSRGGEGSKVFPIVGLNVIVATILSIIVFREPITAQKLIGFVFGVISILFLTR